MPPDVVPATAQDGLKKSPWRRRLLFAAVLTPFVLIWAFIFCDVPLGSTVESAMQQPTPVADADNGYFSLFGRGVAANDDPHAAGVAYVRAANARLKAVDEGQPDDSTEEKVLLKRFSAEPWRGNAKDLVCTPARSDCFAFYVGQRAAIAKQDRDNSLRLARYRALYRFKYFQETIVNHKESPIPSLPTAEHYLVLGKITLAAADGKLEQALSDLSADTEYWRRVLASTDGMASKTVVAMMLSQNYALASEIASRNRHRPEILSALTVLETPLSSAERDWSSVLDNVFRADARFYAFLLLNREVNKSGQASKYPIFMRFLYKPNATVRSSFKFSEQLKRVGAAPAYSVLSVADQADADLDWMMHPGYIDYLRNYMGSILLGVSGNTKIYVRIFANTHNLEARSRLLRLQLDIYRKKIALAKIESYLLQSPDDLLDVYRNKPFRWDAAKQELWFEGIDPKLKNGPPSVADQHIGIRI